MDAARTASRSDDRPIGVFDSGVGGLSILRELQRQLPNEPLLFVGDQAHVPYGPQPLETVRSYSRGVTRFLLDQQAKLVVVACNTASAAALSALRVEFPATPFVGMEPAVKPAAEATRSKVVGVLATPATFQSELYASVVERFAAGVQVIPHTLPGLVEQIEAGNLEGAATRDILAAAIRPLLEQGADTLVLACTHYPLVLPLIRAIAGPAVEVIDPSPAIARQAGRLLVQHDLQASPACDGGTRYFTSGSAARLERQIRTFAAAAGPVRAVRWAGLQLELSAVE